MSYRCSVCSSHSNLHSKATADTANQQMAFDLSHVQKALSLSETGLDSSHSSEIRSSGDTHRHYTPPSPGQHPRQHSQRHTTRNHQQQKQQQQQQQHINDIQVVAGSTGPRLSLSSATESNGANNTASSVLSLFNSTKKDKSKNLWKYLFQKQNEQQHKTSARKKSNAELDYYMQQQQQLQQQLQQKSQISTANAGGSYVFSTSSGTGTVECDCGDDSCPNCNLLCQISGSGW